MALHFDCHRCTNQKQCFLLLLICNTLLACIYYFHEQTFSSYLLSKSKQKQFHLIENPAVKFLRQTLENEYDYTDLLTFYEIVEKEFSLGLRCMRKSTPLISNETTNQSHFTTVT